jgi:hypothetical protein
MRMQGLQIKKTSPSRGGRPLQGKKKMAAASSSPFAAHGIVETLLARVGCGPRIRAAANPHVSRLTTWPAAATRRWPRTWCRSCSRRRARAR